MTINADVIVSGGSGFRAVVESISQELLAGDLERNLQILRELIKGDTWDSALKNHKAFAQQDSAFKD